MILSELIRKRTSEPATAIPATAATEGGTTPSSVAIVATVALANPRNADPPTAMMVPHIAIRERYGACVGGIGSHRPDRLRDTETVRERFEERAAILEFDAGMNRKDAEHEALEFVMQRYRLRQDHGIE